MKQNVTVSYDYALELSLWHHVVLFKKLLFHISHPSLGNIRIIWYIILNFMCWVKLSSSKASQISLCLALTFVCKIMMVLMDSIEHCFCQGGRRLTPKKYMHVITKMMFDFCSIWLVWSCMCYPFSPFYWLGYACSICFDVWFIIWY